MRSPLRPGSAIIQMQVLRRKDRPRCGAKTRAGGRCLVRVEPGKRRCRFHGGLSTGPKTEAGRARIANAQRQRWCAYRERVEQKTAPAVAAESQSWSNQDPWKEYCPWPDR
jgi:hypothetical protein